jgi:protein-S-isoprenylcysteine O-methyltransferase Ste14
MKLLDHFPSAGDTFFRRRSYLPLLLLPAFVLSLRAGSTTGGVVRTACEAMGFAISAIGLAVRVYTIGSAPPGTSERSTRDPRAALLNTTGAYSVVRHPLYLGNSLIAFGLALFTVTWFMPTIVVLAALLYHERICTREEVFLEARFGDAFRAWSREVPAMVPSFRRFRAAPGRFRWKKVVAREFHALFVIGAGFFVLDAARYVFATGQLAADPVWLVAFAATGVLFVVLTLVKKLTRLLHVSETSDGCDERLSDP